MSFYFKESPLIKELIKQVTKNKEDDLSYEIWRKVCKENGWIEVNIQQDEWIGTIKDETKRTLVISYNSLNQDLKWNSKKKEKRLFRRGDEVISFEKDLEYYWDYMSQSKSS